MEEIEIINEKGETDDIVEIYDFPSLKIEQDNIIYELNFKFEKNDIILSTYDKEKYPFVQYKRKLSLKELKDLNKVFGKLNSLNGFYDYLKLKSESKKLSFLKSEDKISIIIFDEFFEIYLFPNKKESEINKIEIYNDLLIIKEKIKKIDILEKENKELKNKIAEFDTIKKSNEELKQKIEQQNKEIFQLKDKLKYIINKSEIMSDEERKLILLEIQNKMHKKIKNFEKLYQATIDGGAPINFHSKCDNIPNTLILIKSKGHRRFGGFTPIPWESEEKGIFINDSEKRTFVFSLDNKKIFNLKNNDNAVFHDKSKGPCFGLGFDIGIEGNPLIENKLYTYQKSFDYKGGKNSLSEYNGKENLKIIEYEVFKIIFY